MKNNTGIGSTGYHSTGNWSTGDWSTGNRSTGNWSISNYSVGHFSTIDYSGFGAFDKHCTLEDWEKAEKPVFIFLELTKWVDVEKMTDKEKQENPNYKTTGGFLKVYDYKEAWKIAWDNATESDKELLYNLPNFDAEVFKKISGIDVNEEKHTEYTVAYLEKILGKKIKIVGE